MLPHFQYLNFVPGPSNSFLSAIPIDGGRAVIGEGLSEISGSFKRRFDEGQVRFEEPGKDDDGVTAIPHARTTGANIKSILQSNEALAVAPASLVYSSISKPFVVQSWYSPKKIHT